MFSHILLINSLRVELYIQFTCFKYHLSCYGKVLYPNIHLYTESFKKKQDTEGVAIF